MRKGLKMALYTVIIAAFLCAELLLIVRSTRIDTDVVLPEQAEETPASITAERVNALDLKSSRYTHHFATEESLSRLTTEGFEPLLGNDSIEIWLRPENYDIRVVNLQSGYIWGGIEESTADGMNKRWKNTAASLVIVNYLDKQLSEKTLYMADSKTKRSHTVEGDTATFTATWDDIELTLQFTMTLNCNGFTIALQDDTIVKDTSNPITENDPAPIRKGAPFPESDLFRGRWV